MVDRLDLADASRRFGTAEDRFDSSIDEGEVTLYGPALEEGAGKRLTAIFYDSPHVVEARWMYGGNGVRSRRPSWPIHRRGPVGRLRWESERDNHFSSTDYTAVGVRERKAAELSAAMRRHSHAPLLGSSDVGSTPESGHSIRDDERCFIGLCMGARRPPPFQSQSETAETEWRPLLAGSRPTSTATPSRLCLISHSGTFTASAIRACSNPVA